MLGYSAGTGMGTINVSCCLFGIGLRVVLVPTAVVVASRVQVDRFLSLYWVCTVPGYVPTNLDMVDAVLYYIPTENDDIILP